MPVLRFRKVADKVLFAGDGKLESGMDSKLALQQKESLFRAVRQLTPEQRLNAFLTYCRLVTGH